MAMKVMLKICARARRVSAGGASKCQAQQDRRRSLVKPQQQREREQSGSPRQPEVAVVLGRELLEVFLDVRPAVVLVADCVPPFPPEVEGQADAPEGADDAAEDQARVPVAEVGEDVDVPPRRERPEAVHPGAWPREKWIVTKSWSLPGSRGLMNHADAHQE